MNDTTSRTAPNERPSLPWWRSGMVWLVIAGPAAVVVASLITAAVAWTHVDPIVTANGRFGPNDDVATPRDPKDPLAPAQKARNHAATPAQ
ncbi:MAG: nitrogen fixation protein FixH [Piscinibacter sp.]|uniref:nitrogen fixation protein FixH n=1 Tax=Piscinibacter sp. TaxID=1903157 RepID=UPI00258BFC67|nr:nitrogen fixation protein FixH [Piscinibacter sp.]MCW5663946.1 nitrogen fixation protein FixH [Piscinibacter sp.]